MLKKNYTNIIESYLKQINHLERKGKKKNETRREKKKKKKKNTVLSNK